MCFYYFLLDFLHNLQRRKKWFIRNAWKWRRRMMWHEGEHKKDMFCILYEEEDEKKKNRAEERWDITWEFLGFVRYVAVCCLRLSAFSTTLHQLQCVIIIKMYFFSLSISSLLFLQLHWSKGFAPSWAEPSYKHGWAGVPRKYIVNILLRCDAQFRFQLWDTQMPLPVSTYLLL